MLAAVLAAACLCLAMLSALAAAPTRADSMAPAAADDSQLRLSIERVSPAVVRPDGEVTVRGSVTNLTEQTQQDLAVRVVTGPPTTSRTGVAEWADSTEPAIGPTAATQALDDALAAGAAAAFTITMPANALPLDRPYGAVAISVEVGDTAVHTFVGYQRSKEYEPVTVTWAAPVTLPADGTLLGPDPGQRAAAWTQALGPASTADRMLNALDEDMPLVVDAALLRTDGAAGEAEEEIRRRFAARLERALRTNGGILLPAGDPDLAALAAADAPGAALASAAANDARELAGAIDDPEVLADVAWPIDSRLTSPDVGALARSFDGRIPLVLTSASALASLTTPTIARRTAEGSTVLAADNGLAAAIAGTTPDDVGLARQRLVADSAAIVGELPGTARSLLVVPPRDSSVDAAAYARVVDDLVNVPWLRRGSAADIRNAVDDAATPDAPITYLPQDNLAPQPATAATPLSPYRVSRLAQDREQARAFAQIREDGEVFLERTENALRALASTRWRGRTTAWTEAVKVVHDDITAADRAVTVNAGQVNFFADTGRLQITLVNGLDVGLRDLQVALVPGNPVLRVDAQPEPVSIGPGSRQTVAVQATALAAGRVPVDIRVQTPNGDVVSQPASLRVRVSPTGEWIYWVIAAVALLLLLVGTWRTLRGGRGRRRDAVILGPELPQKGP